MTGARGPAGAALSDKLEARGIATYLPKTESLAEIDAMILGLGVRTRHEAEAKQKVAALDAQIAGIAKAVDGKPRPRVLLVFGLEPVSVAGPASFADEMIQRAGGTNVVTEGAAAIRRSASSTSSRSTRTSSSTPRWPKPTATSDSPRTRRGGARSARSSRAT